MSGSGSPARTATPVRTRLGVQGTRGLQRDDHHVGDDHHVAGRAAEQRFLHHADRAEACLQCRAGLALEACLQRLDQALRRAGAQQVHDDIGHVTARVWRPRS